MSDPRETTLASRIGPVRAHLLGIEAVRGDGTPFRAGGRVVKNVTGYDLTRFVCGARGRWAIITRVHWRLLRRPAVTRVASFAASSTRALWEGLDAIRSGGCEPLALSVMPLPAEPASVPHAGAPSQCRVEIIESGTDSVCTTRIARARAQLLAAGLTESAPVRAIDDNGPDAPPSSAHSARRVAGGTPPRLETVPVRVRLPYSAWRATNLWTEQSLAWQTVYPFAHFGLARLDLTGTNLHASLASLRRQAAEHGGTVALESIPAAGCPPEVDPWGEGEPTHASHAAPIERIANTLRAAWDPHHTLAWPSDRSRTP